MEYDKIKPKSHSGAYDCLGPDPMQNTQGRYIPILTVAVFMLTLSGLYLNQQPLNSYLLLTNS